jgi:hypothetical protein
LGAIFELHLNVLSPVGWGLGSTARKEHPCRSTKLTRRRMRIIAATIALALTALLLVA